jgi:16S rRNA (guanine(966)-N(2))-methyltransferase RsmD
MRIISGKHKGRRITIPSHFKIRPTTDFAKKGLFDILEHRIDWENLSVLDLFSGTGYISYEFASRGAKYILAVDIEPTYTKFIRNTASFLKMPIQTITMDVFKFLQKQHNHNFNVIFCDPPYDLKNIELLPNLILSNKLLHEDGIIIIEHDKTVLFNQHSFFIHKRNYSKVHFSFFSKNAEKYFFK